MKKLFKALRKHPVFITIFAWMLHKYFWLVWLTQRKTIQNSEALDTLLAEGKPIIIALWHGRICLAPFIGHGKKYAQANVVISRHSDGAFIARVLKFFGCNAIRGSSNRPASDSKGAKDRGGTKALRASCNVLQNGEHLVITPDGPKGPRMRAAEGVAIIAKLSNATVVPVAISHSRAIRFKSWDRFMLPLPFGRTIMIFGSPFINKEDEPTQKIQHAIEEELNRITVEADRQMGQTPVQPEAIITK